jgi:hypothetical protein
MVRLGYPESPTASNREFIPNATPDVLNALDGNTRLLALSPTVLLVYSARPAGRDRPWETSVVRAFFVDARSGALIRQQTWPKRPRTSPSQFVDSEARVFSLSGGRYVVSARDTLSVFTEAGESLGTYRSTNAGPFSIAITPDRRQIVMRSRAGGDETVYSWLNVDDFRVEHTISRSEPAGSATPLAAVADGPLIGASDGTHHASFDQTDRLVCSDLVCQNADPVPICSEAPGAPERVALLASRGMGVAKVSGGLLWSRTVSQDLGLGHMQFQEIAASSDSRRIALEVIRGRKGHQDFDGLHLDQEAEILVYDSSTGKRVFAAPHTSVNGDRAFALSPDGSVLWTFDGKIARGFAIPE